MRFPIGLILMSLVCIFIIVLFFTHIPNPGPVEIAGLWVVGGILGVLGGKIDGC